VNINRENLAWAAGFIDGDGHITKKHSHLYGCQSGYTVPEVLIKLSCIFPFGKIYGPYNSISQQDYPRKPTWTWSVSKFEYVQAVVAMLWPWLSNYRKDQYKDFINSMKSATKRHQSFGWHKKIQTLCRNGHDNWVQWKQNRICKTCRNIRQNNYRLNIT
jgi:hypothetical protein